MSKDEWKKLRFILVAVEIQMFCIVMMLFKIVKLLKFIAYG